MARVIILSFDDNAAAEAFVNHTWDAQDTHSPYPAEFMPVAISAMIVAHAKIEAMVARPTVSCRCNIVGMTEYFRNRNRRRRSTGKFEDPLDRLEYSQEMGQWRKTERFGWLIHTKCKRPGYYIVHRFIQNILIGIGCNDLLPELKEKRDGPIEPDATADGTSTAEPVPSEHVPDSSGPTVLHPEVQDQPGS